MVKGSDSPAWGLSELFLLCSVGSFERKRIMKKSTKKVIAYRKSCKAVGTGLSHYILMDKKAK
jgi:modified peptide precursor CbpA